MIKNILEKNTIESFGNWLNEQLADERYSYDSHEPQTITENERKKHKENEKWTLAANSEIDQLHRKSVLSFIWSCSHFHSIFCSNLYFSTIILNFQIPAHRKLVESPADSAA